MFDTRLTDIKSTWDANERIKYRPQSRFQHWTLRETSPQIQEGKHGRAEISVSVHPWVFISDSLSYLTHTLEQKWKVVVSTHVSSRLETSSRSDSLRLKKRNVDISLSQHTDFLSESHLN